MPTVEKILLASVGVLPGAVRKALAVDMADPARRLRAPWPHPLPAEDSSGLRRGFIPRADGTEERTYGSATGGFDAAEWSQRVAEHHGDVTEAMRAWLVETGRAAEDADIAYPEVRGWIPE
ncbi:hypothetical protein ACH4E7_21455 [Kitasatospora sp. NPDC018058]|uniref:hypothetical protein n=1 Tax=Kitasatospora sp. NPDC018058 TaxID=3364025 RepID=UPI0037BE6FFC